MVSSNPKLGRHCDLLHPHTPHSMRRGTSAFQFLQLTIKICALPLAQKKKSFTVRTASILEKNLTCVPQLLVEVHFLHRCVQRGPLLATPGVAPLLPRTGSRRGFGDGDIGGAGNLHHGLRGIPRGHIVMGCQCLPIVGQDIFQTGPSPGGCDKSESYCRTHRTHVAPGGLRLLPPSLGSIKEVLQGLPLRPLRPHPPPLLLLVLLLHWSL